MSESPRYVSSAEMRLCREWASDHTHLQSLCLKAGIGNDVVNGDSYGVPGIEDLANMLDQAHRERIKQLEIELDKRNALIDELKGDTA